MQKRKSQERRREFLASSQLPQHWTRVCALQRQPAMPQRVNYVNWSLGTLAGPGWSCPNTNTHVELASHVKWVNWWKSRAVEKRELSDVLRKGVYQKCSSREVSLVAWNLANPVTSFRVLPIHLKRSNILVQKLGFGAVDRLAGALFSTLPQISNCRNRFTARGAKNILAFSIFGKYKASPRWKESELPRSDFKLLENRISESS